YLGCCVMMDFTLDTIRESDRQFLQGIEKKLKCDSEALLAVRALAVPVRLDPELALTVLKSPLVNTNGNSEAILGEILQMPFVHRFPDGTFKYAQDARVYFDAQLQQEQPGGNSNGLYAALNRLLADFYRERRKKLNGGAPPESREARQLTLSESLHRLASDEPERGVEDLGQFAAQAMGPTARADTYAAMNIFQVRAPIIGPGRLEPLFVRAKYCYLAGDYEAAAPLLEQVCSSPEKTFNTDTRRFIFALASHFLGYMYLQRGGGIKPAIKWLLQSVDMRRTLKKPLDTAMALNTLGMAYLSLKKPRETAKAVAALKKAVEIDPDPGSRAMILNTLGTAYLALRPAEPAKAVKALEESVKLAADTAQRAMSLNTLGIAYLALRPAEPAKAVEALEASADLSRNAGNLEQLAMSLNTLGTAYLALRPAKPEKAVEALEEVVKIDLDQASRAMSLNTLGTAYLALRPAEPIKAVAALEESVRLTVDPVNRTIRLTTLGKAYLRSGDPDTAIIKLDESLSLLEKSKDPMEIAPVYNLLGQSYKNRGQLPEAIVVYRPPRP
ncbi:MAG: hypothetical protein Q8L00_05300, partial [Deltaproteobacteria bacterium]|nr:hypothetical protein [Deltaproteobacteria bacterium]